MSGIKKFIEEKNIHFIFEVSLLLKAAFALFEIIGGVLVYFISQEFVIKLVFLLTQDELLEDPKDLIAQYLIHSAQAFSISTQHFAAFFLLSHGIIKLFLVIGLLREKRWYYPAAIIVFTLFVLYQLYRFNFTHSLWLLLITLLDILVIWLTWHEYMYLRKQKKFIA